jgi:hypothetical protein
VKKSGGRASWRAVALAVSAGSEIFVTAPGGYMKEEECMSQFETITAQVGERKLSFEQASHCLTALFRQNSEDSDLCHIGFDISNISRISPELGRLIAAVVSQLNAEPENRLTKDFGD